MNTSMNTSSGEKEMDIINLMKDKISKLDEQNFKVMMKIKMLKKEFEIFHGRFNEISEKQIDLDDEIKTLSQNLETSKGRVDLLQTSGNEFRNSMDTRSKRILDLINKYQSEERSFVVDDNEFSSFFLTDFDLSDENPKQQDGYRNFCNDEYN